MRIYAFECFQCRKQLEAPIARIVHLHQVQVRKRPPRNLPRQPAVHARLGLVQQNGRAMRCAQNDGGSGALPVRLCWVASWLVGCWLVGWLVGWL